jgi:hypothetical protein
VNLEGDVIDGSVPGVLLGKLRDCNHKNLASNQDVPRIECPTKCKLAQREATILKSGQAHCQTVFGAARNSGNTRASGWLLLWSLSNTAKRLLTAARKGRLCPQEYGLFLAYDLQSNERGVCL